MSKPKEIIELEKIYNININKSGASIDDFLNYNYIGRNYYLLNSKKEIIGLVLSENRITEIKGLEALTHLQKLDLSYNQITEIKGLEALTQLQKLDLSYNQITEIKGLEALTQLQALYLSENQITEIKGLEALTQLQALYLSENQITEIKGLEALTQLQELSLSTNQITEIKGLEALTQLQKLDLSYNQITEIKGLEALTHLQELYLHNNSFSKPFLKEENNLDTVRKYFSDKTLAQKKTIQLPAKVMLWGNHTAGKSTFWQYLESDTVENFVKKDNPKSTEVLDIYKYPPNKDTLPQAIIYDFGGQDYYHGLYQAFFSEDSINVLLWNKTTNENICKKANDGTNKSTRHFTWNYWLYQLDYALKKRKQENNRSEMSSEPILLVQTYANKDKRQNYTTDISSFDIVDAFFVSLTKNKLSENAVYQSSLLHLKTSLLHEIEKKRKKTKEEFDYYKSFLNYILSSNESDCILIQELINKNHYTRKKQESESDDDFLAILRAELSELYQKGLVLYYNKENLKDVVWLNPAKTVEHIHKEVLSSKIIANYNGIVPEDTFNKNLNAKFKMKQLFLIIALLFLFLQYNFCLAQQKFITSYQNKDYPNLDITLNGKVKSVVQISRTPSEFCDSISSIRLKVGDKRPTRLQSGMAIRIQCVMDTIVYLFDSNLRPEIIYEKHCYIDDLKEKKREVRICEFENGNWISELFLKYGVVFQHITYKYDSKNNRIARIQNYNKKFGKESFEYDEHNNLVKRITFYHKSRKKATLEEIEAYQYDTHGNLIEKTLCQYYGKGNEINSLKRFVYDDNNRLIKMFNHHELITPNADTYYQYDERGNLTDEKKYYLQEDTVLGEHRIYEYNENGQQTKKEVILGQELYMPGIKECRKLTTSYDDWKNISQQEYYGYYNLLRIVRYVYSYDSSGNWIKREEFAGKNEQELKKIEIVERIIEYY